jgi:hypothetical protein
VKSRPRNGYPDIRFRAVVPARARVDIINKKRQVHAPERYVQENNPVTI